MGATKHKYTIRRAEVIFLPVKHHTSNQIWEEYLKKSLKEKNEILYEAIGFMEQYNGRTRFECIALAMSYKNDIGLNDTYYKANE